MKLLLRRGTWRGLRLPACRSLSSRWGRWLSGGDRHPEQRSRALPAGVQTSGHLRAVQALSLLDTSLDALEEELAPTELAKLQKSQRVLDDALARMENGDVRQARRIASEAKPIVRRLKPAVERSLAPGAAAEAEDDLEDVITEAPGRLE